MGTNWFPGNNPESIPRYGYIPKIALPTVFGDALSYLEMIGRYNAEFNKAIDGINKLAENIETEVQNSVENAKIPVYAELVNNGSVIISPNNWNVSNPEALYEAMGAGKLCILHGNLSFNIDGLPVLQATNNMYFILTQFYQTVINNNSTTVYTVFVNYDETHVRFVKMNLYKENSVYSSEITDMREVHLPTDIEFEQIDNLFKKCVFVYKGRENIPDEQGQYIELMENATENDLSRFFVVQTGGSMYVPECAPAVCVDSENGNIGELRYGGNSTPWARVYSYGIKLNSNFAGAILHLTEVDGELLDAIGANSVSINDVNERVDGVEDDLTALGENVDSKDGENVKYIPQARSTAEKARARANIGAAPTDNPVFTGELALGNGFGASVLFNVTTQGGVTALDFSQSPVRIKGVISPVNETEVATKGYVDYVVGDVDAVKYSVQDKTDNERRVARENIGALSAASPYAYNTLSVENNDIVVVLQPGRVSGNKALTIAGTAGDTIIAGVATPTENNHAANKAYVDNKLVLSEGNVKFDVAQQLTEDQRGRACDNIHAMQYDNAYANGRLDIYANDGEYAELVLGDRENVRSFRYNDETEVELKDGDGELAPLIVGPSFDDNGCVIHSQLRQTIAPYRVVINSANNTWTCTRNGSAVGDLSAVINAFGNGTNVIVEYTTVGISTVGYMSVKCCGFDIGLVCEGYDGSAWKRYTLNLNGTVTAVAL